MTTTAPPATARRAEIPVSNLPEESYSTRPRPRPLPARTARRGRLATSGVLLASIAAAGASVLVVLR